MQNDQFKLTVIQLTVINMNVVQNTRWPKWPLNQMTDVQKDRSFNTKKTDNIQFWITSIFVIPNPNGRQFMNSMNNGRFSSVLE